MATAIVLVLSYPLWVLCEKASVAFTLAPALICIWLAVWLIRET